MSANDIFKNLVTWLAENGGHVHDSLYLDTTNEANRTVRTNYAHMGGTQLVNIPAKCCIGNTSIFETCLTLLTETSLGEKSFYYPYIASLPTEDQLEDLPIYKYARSDLQDLSKISNDFVMILSQYFNEVDKFYLQYVKTSNLPDKWKEYRYALYSIALYHSRAWDKRGFIPFIDLIQHENNTMLSSNVTIFAEKCEFKSLKYLKKGDELSWCYSLSNNLQLYANYGISEILQPTFIPSTLSLVNTHDNIDVYIKKCLLENNIQAQGEIKIVYTSNGLYRNVMTLGRLLNITEKDIKTEPIKIDEDVFINMENEHAMIKMFLKQLHAYKKIYTIKTDNEKFTLVKNLVEHNLFIINKIIDQLRKSWNDYMDIS